MPDRSVFAEIYNQQNPFQFDQAVGRSTLTEQGSATIKIGQQYMILNDCLYSPRSASGIVSASRLQSIAAVFPDYAKMLLVKHHHEQRDMPIA